MKNLNIIAAAVISVVMLATSAFAQDLLKGVKATRSGDYAIALQELRPLAEQGNAEAQAWLGVMYQHGYGVPQDLVLAHMWYNLAATKGFETYANNRDRIAKYMTPQDISKAQAMAKECMSNNYKNCGY